MSYSAHSPNRVNANPNHRLAPYLVRLLAVTSLCLALIVVVGCTRGQATNNEAYDVQVRVQPDSPRVGPATVNVRILDENGSPVKGADVSVEGNMTHAGMVPVISSAPATSEGNYATRDFKFTMGGDWVITVTAKLPDGTKITRQIEVPGVSSQSPNTHGDHSREK